MRRQLASLAPDRLHVGLMLGLTFATGVVDAVGFLGLDRVFTGNMTGNVVILGMALTGSNQLPVAGPLLALLGFMAGAVITGRLLRTSAEWSRRTSYALLASGALTASVGLSALVVARTPEVAWAMTSALGLAMGVQAAAARAVAVRDVTTVVVTSTITGLAADGRWGAGTAVGSRGVTARRWCAVLAITAGAGCGAALLRWEFAAGALAAGMVTTAVVVIKTVHARSRAGGALARTTASSRRRRDRARDRRPTRSS